MSGGVCVVAGVGPGNGESFTRRFAGEGRRVAMLARNGAYLDGLAGQIEGAVPYVCDLTDGAKVAATFAEIRESLGPIEVLVHNAGNFIMKPFTETTAEEFEGLWRTNAYSLFLTAQAALPDMLSAGAGNIVVIGATASLRGGPLFAAFAPSKAAQRLLAQSLARQLGPKGIHVSYVVIDGVIDSARTRQFLSDKPSDFFVDPDGIADVVSHLVSQQKRAWTFEVDLRPYGEKW